jgi:hypothetical protein
MVYEVWKDITGNLYLMTTDHTRSTGSLTFVCRAKLVPLDEHGNELPVGD